MHRNKPDNWWILYFVPGTRHEMSYRGRSQECCISPAIAPNRPLHWPGHYSVHNILSLQEDSFMIPFLWCCSLAFSFFCQSWWTKEEERRYLVCIVYGGVRIYVIKGHEFRGAGWSDFRMWEWQENLSLSSCREWFPQVGWFMNAPRILDINPSCPIARQISNADTNIQLFGLPVLYTS